MDLHIYEIFKLHVKFWEVCIPIISQETGYIHSRKISLGSSHF